MVFLGLFCTGFVGIFSGFFVDLAGLSVDLAGFAWACAGFAVVGRWIGVSGTGLFVVFEASCMAWRLGLLLPEIPGILPFRLLRIEGVLDPHHLRNCFFSLEPQ